MIRYGVCASRRLVLAVTLATSACGGGSDEIVTITNTAMYFDGGSVRVVGETEKHEKIDVFFDDKMARVPGSKRITINGQLLARQSPAVEEVLAKLNRWCRKYELDNPTVTFESVLASKDQRFKDRHWNYITTLSLIQVIEHTTASEDTVEEMEGRQKRQALEQEKKRPK